MQINSKTSDEFLLQLNEQNKVIQDSFLKQIKKLVKTVSIKVMLGDSTVLEQQTFDPNNVQNFFKKILTKLSSWEADEISNSNTEDLRRIFVKFKIIINNYGENQKEYKMLGIWEIIILIFFLAISVLP